MKSLGSVVLRKDGRYFNGMPSIPGYEEKVPFRGTRPFSARLWKWLYPRNPQALAVHRIASGIPSSSATANVNFRAPSPIMQVTGGTPDVAVSLSPARSSFNGPAHVLSMDSIRVRVSWVTSSSTGGRPSGIASNLNEGRPSSEFLPQDRSRRFRLYSVRTKVT